ncbi:MAG: DUF169 domain-containing protein [Nitrososphaerota archaeon]|nr:DUF169 domain-containing protein [Candidatus Bathyarchaeota archaeon]MDW8024166.1 DUF169 domain-containing protein [Nitrososphaerota archaeon]
MKKKTHAELDLEIFDKLNLERKPVGVKFSYLKPEDFKKLDKKSRLCEFISEAQKADRAFYIDKENEDCYGKKVLGMEGFPAFAESGLIGSELKIFQDPRANARLYYRVPILRPGTVNYVIFSPIDKLMFNPDLIIVTANVSQAEVILRAMTYSTGEPWVSKHTFVLGCAWLFVYPYITGKMNYVVSGMTFGSKVVKEPPEGYIVISIPHDWIPVITRNLREMPWSLPSYEGKEKHFKVFNEILKKYGQN